MLFTILEAASVAKITKQNDDHDLVSSDTTRKFVEALLLAVAAFVYHRDQNVFHASRSCLDVAMIVGTTIAIQISP